MDSYEIEVFGDFGGCEIRGAVDQYGNYWFTRQIVSKALGMQVSSLTHMMKNHSSEFHEGVEYMNTIFDGKRRILFSEEGFLTICDMARSERAYRLRKWMRQQFRVKHRGDTITVQPKGLQPDDLSDLGPDFRLMYNMLNNIAENRRMIVRLDEAKAAIVQEQAHIKKRMSAAERTIRTIEDGVRLGPGEMTAIQMANHVGWVSKSGAPHNLAIILAATNHRFIEYRWMVERREKGPDGRLVAVQVFTTRGVQEFINTIDINYVPGQRFTIEPSRIALDAGYKNKRNVLKATPTPQQDTSLLPSRPIGDEDADDFNNLALPFDEDDFDYDDIPF